MEYFWLFLATVTAALVIYWIAVQGWEENKYLTIFPVMSGILYLMRRFYRKTQERTSNGE